MEERGGWMRKMRKVAVWKQENGDAVEEED